MTSQVAVILVFEVFKFQRGTPVAKINVKLAEKNKYTLLSKDV